MNDLNDLEIADVRHRRPDMVRRRGQLALARRGLTPCCECGQPATAERDGQHYCALDARVARQREQIAAMRTGR